MGDKVSDGREGEESVKDEVGNGTVAGPDGPIAPAPLHIKLAPAGRRRPMIDQLPAVRTPGREGRRGMVGQGGEPIA